MQSLSQFRQHFGLTQANLALYLSISLSLLKMIKSGKRNLPLSAGLAFMKLESFAFDKQTTTEKLLVFADTQPAPTANKPLSKYLRNMELQLRRYENQLATTEERYQQVLNRIALVAHLQNQLEEELTTKEKTAWLHLMTAQNNVDLDRFGKAMQQVLQWKMDCLLYSIQHGKEMLNPQSDATK